MRWDFSSGSSFFLYFSKPVFWVKNDLSCAPKLRKLQNKQSRHLCRSTRPRQTLRAPSTKRREARATMEVHHVFSEVPRSNSFKTSPKKLIKITLLLYHRMIHTMAHVGVQRESCKNHYMYLRRFWAKDAPLCTNLFVRKLLLRLSVYASLRCSVNPKPG